MSKGTRHHTVRIDDETWAAAKAAAAEDDLNVSEVIRDLLAQWLEERRNMS